MRLMLFALPFLAATSVFAQTQTETQLQTALELQKTIVIQNSCPVGMFAQRRDSGQTLWITSFEDGHQSQKINPLKPGNTGVHVFLSSHDKATIRQVEIAVYYVAPGVRALPVAAHGTPPDLSKTFSLSAENGASLKLTGDLLVGPAAGITRIHLLSIDYADGTSWRPAGESACSVEPSRFLLVNHR